MSRCIELAKNGLGTTYPNPIVGSVIVTDDKIIGEGWHFKAGLPHAEVNAINSVEDPNLLKQATIYVSLEPCSHHGKTPPCSDLIIRSGIKNVVVGSVDPNPQVAGKGIEKLEAAGCNVLSGILQESCDELNKRFFTFHHKKRPYIILKWAQTKDGYIAPDTRESVGPVWITNELSRQRVHKMRSEEQAILVGSNTVILDNPSLTTRDWDGDSPIRIVLNHEQELPDEAKVFDGSVETLVFQSGISGFSNPNAQVVRLDTDRSIVEQVCSELYSRGIQSLIVEGGRQTLQSFIDSGLWDEAHVYEGTSEFGSGTSAPEINGQLTETEYIGGDKLSILKNSNR